MRAHAARVEDATGNKRVHALVRRSFGDMHAAMRPPSVQRAAGQTMARARPVRDEPEEGGGLNRRRLQPSVSFILGDGAEAPHGTSESALPSGGLNLDLLQLDFGDGVSGEGKEKAGAGGMGGGGGGLGGGGEGDASTSFGGAFSDDGNHDNDGFGNANPVFADDAVGAAIDGNDGFGAFPAHASVGFDEGVVGDGFGDSNLDFKKGEDGGFGYQEAECSLDWFGDGADADFSAFQDVPAAEPQAASADIHQDLMSLM